MDWLTRLPVVGPLVSRLMRTHLWHAYERLEETHWSRLAAAITFISFLALFPMLALGAAIGAATLTPDRMARLEEFLSRQVPGISDEINIQSFVDNAGTIGSVAALLLLFTGLGWIRSLRECLREVWKLADEQDTLVAGKLKDLAMLVGLGLVGVLSVVGSSFAVGAVDWAADQLGLDKAGVVAWLLRIVPVLAAVVVDALLLAYVLTRVPGVHPDRRSVLEAAVMGAVGFEVLKLLLGGYLRGVAAKSMYGTFGIPIALLIWISLMAKILLFCTAWTATAESLRDPERGGEGDPSAGDPSAGDSNAGDPSAGSSRASDDDRTDGSEPVRPQARPKPPTATDQSSSPPT